MPGCFYDRRGKFLHARQPEWSLQRRMSSSPRNNDEKG